METSIRWSICSGVSKRGSVFLRPEIASWGGREDVVEGTTTLQKLRALFKETIWSKHLAAESQLYSFLIAWEFSPWTWLLTTRTVKHADVIYTRWPTQTPECLEEETKDTQNHGKSKSTWSFSKWKVSSLPCIYQIVYFSPQSWNATSSNTEFFCRFHWSFYVFLHEICTIL